MGGQAGSHPCALYPGLGSPGREGRKKASRGQGFRALFVGPTGWEEGHETARGRWMAAPVRVNRPALAIPSRGRQRGRHQPQPPFGAAQTPALGVLSFLGGIFFSRMNKKDNYSKKPLQKDGTGRRRECRPQRGERTSCAWTSTNIRSKPQELLSILGRLNSFVREKGQRSEQERLGNRMKGSDEQGEKWGQREKRQRCKR